MTADPFAADLAIAPVGFTGSTLDRADRLRRDPQAIWAATTHPGARWLVLDGLKPVMNVRNDSLDLLWLRRSEVPEGGTHVLLGLDDGMPRFAIAASSVGLPGTAMEARAVAAQLSDGRAQIVAQARSLIDWHARHRFCAACGGPTDVRKAGYSRVCESCGAEHFPRTDPVVIMLALRGDKALLGRGVNFPPGLMSALAGFVEPGENLEEAVARELFEEAGVRVGRVRYVASQPWPFPSSLMIGAFAEAESFDLDLDHEEIAEARWFTRDEVHAALAGQGPFSAPQPLAIANTLLRTWAG